MANDADGRRFELSEEQAHLALVAPGQGALAGLKQLLIELESDTLSPEGAARVRKAVGEAIRATGLPEDLCAGLDKGLR